jgi:hypothetical protein
MIFYLDRNGSTCFGAVAWGDPVLRALRYGKMNWYVENYVRSFSDKFTGG